MLLLESSWKHTSMTPQLRGGLGPVCLRHPHAVRALHLHPRLPRPHGHHRHLLRQDHQDHQNQGMQLGLI